MTEKVSLSVRPIMSGFLKDNSEYESERYSDINFDDALELHGGGSTCDIYKTRWQRRTVFVKRLKEGYRTKPLYLDALDKEFEIGVKLKHPSLPEYREYHRDYIVIDFIDGLTLAEMIKRGDPWLRREKNVVKMLMELIDVVAYLHSHNVVHCDIKPDNIMITSNGHNLVLIDFDKCYTDALDDTSGHPGKYGLPLDIPGRMEMDFRGIANVVERIKEGVPDFKFRKYPKFVKSCYKPDVTADELLDLLDKKTSDEKTWSTVSLIGLVVIGIIAAALFYLSDTRDNDESEREDRSEVPSAINENYSEAMETNTLKSEETQQDAIKNEGHINFKSQEDLYLEDQKRAVILDQYIAPLYAGLYDGLDRLNSIKNDNTYTAEQMLDSIRRLVDMEDEIKAETWAILEETFPDITNERQKYRILSFSKVFTNYNHRAAREETEYGREYTRRLNQ